MQDSRNEGEVLFFDGKGEEIYGELSYEEMRVMNELCEVCMLDVVEWDEGYDKWFKEMEGDGKVVEKGEFVERLKKVIEELKED